MSIHFESDERQRQLAKLVAGTWPAMLREKMRARSTSSYAIALPVRLELEPAPKWQARPCVDKIVAGDRFLAMKELSFKVGMGKSTIYRWIDDGMFPAGTELAPKMVRWRESVIDKWMASFSSGAPSKAR